MRSLQAAILATILIVSHVYTLGKATDESKRMPKDEGSDYILPAPVLKITTLEFHGMVSDYLFLKSLVFIGSTFERRGQPRVKDWEWLWLHNVLTTSTELDPYFLDPYYFANANFMWEGKLMQETNVLLKRGCATGNGIRCCRSSSALTISIFSRTTTVQAPTYMEETQQPGGNALYASLATKLAYKSRRTENAVLFIDEILRNTDNEQLRSN